MRRWGPLEQGLFWLGFAALALAAVIAGVTGLVLLARAVL